MDNFKKFIQSAREIKLGKEEKDAIRHSVLNFMKEHPVRIGNPSRLVYQSRWDWSNMFGIKLNYASSMAILLIIALFAGGGAGLAAEKSLPGDVLYPVKVGINEEVRGWLSVSDEAKAEWEIERAQRRLEEAEELAENGSLDADIRAELEARFEAHAGRVSNRIEKFENKENFNAAVDVSSRFETSLQAHERILDKLSEHDQTKAEVKKEIKPIKVRIKSEADKAKRNREKVELRIKNNLNVEGSVRGAEDNDNSEESESDDNKLEIESETEIKADSRKGLEVKSNLNLGL